MLRVAAAALAAADAADAEVARVSKAAAAGAASTTTRRLPTSLGGGRGDVPAEAGRGRDRIAVAEGAPEVERAKVGVEGLVDLFFCWGGCRVCVFFLCVWGGCWLFG